MYALVDANSFYASCEVVFRPEWRNRPVVVLSNNDGCVVALNRAAKAAGIEKFKPFFEVRQACERADAVVCSSNYELYGDLSAKMMDVISRYAPEQYIYSIDEIFLSLKNIYPAVNDLENHARKIRRAVWKECRLPVCVGIAPTLTLAKIANHAAKKFKGYQGVCVLDCASERNAVLAKLDVEDIWGVGKRISAKLRLMNVKTALDLANMAPKHARKQFSVEMERTILDLNGIAAKQWDEARADKKQIYSTRSMGERITDLESLQQALSKHASIAA
ncbi:MAG: Y-family DNA polymerase, partial [Shewanella sp.]|nr:Y-family DNA polymerase [Shewanella sp.]